MKYKCWWKEEEEKSDQNKSKALRGRKIKIKK